MNPQVKEMNLSHLTELLRMSKSLVFVPDRATARVVRKACHALGLPQWVSGEADPMMVIPFERNYEDFATICVLPSMVTGWHSKAEQVIWIGTVNCEPAVYMQAVNRAPGRPVHHLENWGTP